MIKKIISNYPRLYNILWFVNTILKSNWKKVRGDKKKYPKVIQLPITDNCNAKCVMCNVWKMDSSNEMSKDELDLYLEDEIFKNILSVGINGGEPSLVTNLPEYAREILKLPKIKSLNIISHGFSTKLLLRQVTDIYSQCKDESVSFHISISLDGVGEIHNKVRGMNGVFDKTLQTIMEIKDNQYKYCDSFDVGCTVVRQNVEYLMELDTFAKIYDINIMYRLGIENTRIDNHDVVNNFFITDTGVQAAKEFFYYLFLSSKKMSDKFTYFSIFYYIDNGFKGRLKGCSWQEDGITLDSRGRIYYCAVESREIGNLKTDKGVDKFFSQDNIAYRKNIIKNKCDSCIHYTDRPELLKFVVFLKYIVMNKIHFRLYKLKSLARMY